MDLIGQRWRFAIANSEINVDNAFSWQLWGQERLVVNAETVQASGGWFVSRQRFREPWLTQVGDAELGVQLYSSLHGLHCKVELAGEILAPTAVFEARWRGPRGSWPEEAAWSPQPSLRGYGRWGLGG